MSGLCVDLVWLMGPRSPEWFQVVMTKGEFSQDWTGQDHSEGRVEGAGGG